MSEGPKFTPGPWAVTSTRGDVHSQARNGRNWICRGPNVDATTSPLPEETHANAHLISAAPDLYAALDAIIDGRMWSMSSEKFDAALAALAKARGKS